MDACRTPISQMQLSAELRDIIMERNLLTTKTRMKVLSALEDNVPENEDVRKVNLRSKAIHEILTSEASYLKHLELIMKYFMKPIQTKNLMSNEDFTIIFGSIETIYYVNGELLHELKYNQENIAAAFLKLAPFMKLYSVYACDYERALNQLNLLQKKSAELSEFITSQENRPEVSTKLISLLITPIQRVPRYCLLLKEVIAHTAAFHPDYPVLQDSYQQVESAAQHINHLMLEQENMQKMLALQKSFHKGKPLIVSPGRRFIKAGKLMKICHSGRKVQPRYLILLSDMLIYCKLLHPDPSTPNSVSCTCVLPLKKCRVQWVMGKTIFKVSCLNENFVLYSTSPEESGLWVDAISEAVKFFNECRQTLRKDSSSRRPLRGRDINSLWQRNCDLSPSSRLARKRSRSEERVEGLSCQGWSGASQSLNLTDGENQPSPCKISKTSSKSTSKECLNKVVSPDILFPMREELTKPSDRARVSADALASGNACKCASSSSRPDGADEVCCSVCRGQRVEEEAEAKGKASWNGLCFRAGSTRSPGQADSKERKNSWRNRCSRAARSLSLNLHHTLRRHR